MRRLALATPEAHTPVAPAPVGDQPSHPNEEGRWVLLKYLARQQGQTSSFLSVFFHKVGKNLRYFLPRPLEGGQVGVGVQIDHTIYPVRAGKQGYGKLQLAVQAEVDGPAQESGFFDGSTTVGTGLPNSLAVQDALVVAGLIVQVEIAGTAS